jgi:Carboxypeptidase regulatory-like domain
MFGKICKALLLTQRTLPQPAAGRVPILALFTVLAVLLALHSTRVFGQINTATLSGTVKDPSSAVVPDASVVVVLADTGTTRTVQTNSAGLFTVPLLQPGAYTVTISKAGFETATESNIELQVNQLASLNFTLSVGTVGQTVTVTGGVPLLNTETAGLGTVIAEKEIQDLPLNGRQFMQLLQLAPGTVPVSVSQGAVPALGGGGSNVTPAINGGSGRSNLFYVDGIYATDPFFSTLSISPSIDAIREFQEQTHTDQAQFGQSTGGTVNLSTRGGTNQFHGSAYEFYRDAALAARSYFAAVKGGYNQNQFGGTLGGPIIRNKLFFFGFYDGYRETQAANNVAILPTTAELGGDFSALLPTTVIYDPTTYNAATGQTQPFPGNIIPQGRLNQGILAMMKEYVPTPTSSSPNSNNFTNTASNTLNQDQYSVRVDYNIGAKDLLFARWTVNEETTITPGKLPVNPFEEGFNGNNSGVNWVHTFSPTLVSQITGGYNSIYIPQQYAEPNAASLFQTAGFSAGFTDTPGGILVPKTPGLHPSGFFDLNAGWGPIGPQRLGQFSGSVNKQIGSHALMFGASYYITNMYTNWAENDVNFNQQATWNPCGTETAGTCNGVGGNSIASMVLGLPNSAGRQLGNAGVNLQSHIVGLFAQDSWKFRPKLTVNYGLRWDYTAPISEANNRLAGFDINTSLWYLPKNDADTPTGPLPAGVVILNRNTITTPDYRNFSPRFGLSYQVLPTTVVSAGAGVTFDNWSGALQAAQNARGAWPSGSSQNPANLNIAGVSLGATAQNPFGNTQPIIPASPFPSGGGFLDTAWKNLYSWQWNLQVQQQIGTSGSFKLAYVGSSSSRAPLQAPFNISTQLGPTQVLPYPQMQFGFNMIQSIGHMSYNALQAQYTKRYSSGLSVVTAFSWSKNINVGCADYWEGCNIQDPYDMRSNRGVDDVDVPVVFTFAAVYELPFGKGKTYATSGAKSMLFGGWQVNGIVSARGGSPFTPTINFDNANANGGSQRPNVVGQTAGPKSLNEYFNTSAYAVAPRYTYGDAGRNSLRGPGYTDVDFSLFRTFALFERANLEFRAESFNVLNHPNFANPDGTLEDANFGKITAINSSSAPREFQLAGTVRF